MYGSFLNMFGSVTFPPICMQLCSTLTVTYSVIVHCVQTNVHVGLYREAFLFRRFVDRIQFRFGESHGLGRENN